MRTFANWMTVMFMVMHWIFRITVAYMAATGREFIVTPINFEIEVALLFITFICIVLTIKRNKFGGIIYLTTYMLYFGADIYSQIKPLITGMQFSLDIGMNLFTSILAVILSIAVMIDLLSDNVKRVDDKKTEWFYANQDLDKKTDDRDDKNNYRIM